MLLMGGAELEGTHRIAVDRKDAVLKAVEHLAGLGHRRIAFVGDTTSEKFTGYTVGLLQHQLEYNAESIVHILGREYYYEETERQIVRALARDGKSGPTAVIVDSQGLLFPFIQTIRRHKIRVPEDYSLVVYDNVPEVEHLTDVPLTTVGPNISTMAEQAIRSLIGDNDASGRWHDITLPTELIVRQSTLPAEVYQ
ncbi:LacI family transcriptional regulator [Paenibacillus mesophilus]|uniref:substrate-binding domain-containing protein n=1 Tax=Paenibacillus mesophilus TaxID=2582849 RepID=UPI00110DC738|nr:substrate-binding domain-containing protein [Paenibacillus mesophilus]TMV50761.1 LacI family transcriptional regulator [Paenibacillus mesophilus]